MSWNELCDLTFNSISIIGVFIAIIIGLIISKVTDLNREYGELKDSIENIDSELNIKKEYFDKLILDNYEFYKKDNIGKILNDIYNAYGFIFMDNVPYVNEKMQREYYDYVNKIKDKILPYINRNFMYGDCRFHLKIKEGSLDDIILSEVYRIWGGEF